MQIPNQILQHYNCHRVAMENFQGDWHSDLLATIEQTSNALKTSRGVHSTPNTSLTSSWHRPLTVIEVNTATPTPPSTTTNETNPLPPTLPTAPQAAAATTTTTTAAKHHVAQKLLLQDVTAVKSAVVQVAAEVGRHAQSTIDTNNNLRRLGDDQ